MHPTTNSPTQTRNNNGATPSLVHTGSQLAFTKVALTLGTQWLHVVMRHQQATLIEGRRLNTVAAFKEINRVNTPYRLFGMSSAFFRGIVPATTKEYIKGFYKGPLFKGAPELVKQYPLHDSWSHYHPILQHCLIALSAATVAAGTDTIAGGPLERFATYRATSQAKHHKASFRQELSSKGGALQQLQFCYKGSITTFMKTGISCFALFALALPAQQYTQRQFGIQPGDKIPAHVAGLTAIGTGGAIALLTAGLDVGKTIQQMPKANNETTATIMRRAIEQHGLRALTAGLPIKFVMVTLGWGAVSWVTQQNPIAKETHLHTYATESHSKRS